MPILKFIISALQERNVGPAQGMFLTIPENPKQIIKQNKKYEWTWNKYVFIHLTCSLHGC